MKKHNKNEAFTTLLRKMIAELGHYVEEEYIKVEVNSKENPRISIAYPYKNYLIRILDDASIKYQGRDHLQTNGWIYETFIKHDPESIIRLLKLNCGG